MMQKFKFFKMSTITENVENGETKSRSRSNSKEFIFASPNTNSLDKLNVAPSLKGYYGHKLTLIIFYVK